MYKAPKNYQGVALVEVLIGVSLLAVVGVFVGMTVTQFVTTRNEILAQAKKVYLAEEGYETIRLLRDEDWSNISSLSANTYHYLQVTTSSVAIGGSSESIDGQYQRSFLIQPIYRNAAGDIVASTTVGSAVDSDSKKIFIYVSDNNSTTTVNAVLTHLP